MQTSSVLCKFAKIRVNRSVSLGDPAMFFRTLAVATSRTAMRQFSFLISLSRYSGDARWASEKGSSWGFFATGIDWGGDRTDRPSGTRRLPLNPKPGRPTGHERPGLLAP